MKTLADLRRSYHQGIGEDIVRFIETPRGAVPSFADGSSRASSEIARRMAKSLGFAQSGRERITGQNAGASFEQLTRDFVDASLKSLRHLRPGEWVCRTDHSAISNFVQFKHLETIRELVDDNPTLAAAIGQGYVVTPDIVVLRRSVSDAEINRLGDFVEESSEGQPVATTATHTFLRERNQSREAEGDLPMHLHASISCKWTIRSDRSQNTRTEALNLMRNRKGRLPNIVAVTAEPLPKRIASLALGTGYLDCVYHFALPELLAACQEIENGDEQLESLETMIDGHRLRDISDLPFDLCI